MLQFSVLLPLTLLLTHHPTAPRAAGAVRARPAVAGLFDMFKETEAQKKAKDDSFREQKEILARRRDPAKMRLYEQEVAAKRSLAVTGDAELRAMQAGRIEGDSLEVWKQLKQEGKVLTSETAVREPGSERMGSEGLVAQRMDEQMPYIDQGYVDASQPDFMAEIGALFGKKKKE